MDFRMERITNTLQNVNVNVSDGLKRAREKLPAIQIFCIRFIGVKRGTKILSLIL